MAQFRSAAGWTRMSPRPVALIRVRGSPYDFGGSGRHHAAASQVWAVNSEGQSVVVTEGRLRHESDREKLRT